MTTKVQSESAAGQNELTSVVTQKDASPKSSTQQKDFEENDSSNEEKLNKGQKGNLPTAPPAAAHTHILRLDSVGGAAPDVAPLPSVDITNEQDAANRLVDLKTRINHLGNMQKANNDTEQILLFILCCIFLGPLGLLIAICMSGEKEDPSVKVGIQSCIGQVNELRARFDKSPGWNKAEEKVRIQGHLFEGANCVSRQSLQGGL